MVHSTLQRGVHILEQPCEGQIPAVMDICPVTAPWPHFRWKPLKSPPPSSLFSPKHINRASPAGWQHSPLNSPPINGLRKEPHVRGLLPFCLVVHHPWCSPGLVKLHTPLQLFRKVQIPCTPGSWEIPGLWVAERHPPGQMAENRTGRVIWATTCGQTGTCTRGHTHTHAHTHVLPHRLETAQSPQQPPA